MKVCLLGRLFFVMCMVQNIFTMHKESGYVESPFGRVQYIKMWRHKDIERAVPILVCLDKTLQGPEELFDISINYPVILCTFLEAKKIAGEDFFFAEKIFTCFREQLNFESFYLLGCFDECPTVGYCDLAKENRVSCVMRSEIKFDCVGWVFGVRELLERIKVTGKKNGRILNFHLDHERLEIMDSFFSGKFPLTSFVFVEKSE